MGLFFSICISFIGTATKVPLCLNNFCSRKAKKLKRIASKSTLHNVGRGIDVKSSFAATDSEVSVAPYCGDKF